MFSKENPDKTKNIAYLLVIALCAAGAIYLLMSSDSDGSEAVTFVNQAGASKGNGNDKSNKRITAPKREVIKVPDPSYREAPVFEDFQAIAKMYVHAMAPYKRETAAWEEKLVSLRMQREKSELYENAAEMSENKLIEAKNVAAIEKIENGLDVSNHDGLGEESEGTVDEIETVKKVSSIEAINIRNVKLNFYTKGNKYSSSSASFIIGTEHFSNVKKGQVFASQFQLVNLLDNEFCAELTDLVSRSKKQYKVCRT